MQRIESVGGADAVASSHVPRKCLFEALDFFAEHVPAALEHPCHGSVEILAEFRIRRGQIEEGYLQRIRPSVPTRGMGMSFSHGACCVQVVTRAERNSCGTCAG